MFNFDTYFAVAISLLIFAGLVLFVLHRQRSRDRDWRIRRMMMSCGIDEAVAARPDELLDIDMDAVRVRCRHCPVTYLCERWLDGEAVATNSFCPNAWYFRRAATERS